MINELPTNELKHILNNIEDYALQGETLKNDVATTIVKIAPNLIIKRFNQRNFFYNLTHIFQPNRAVRCWKNARLLLSLNLATPKPIATIEYKPAGRRLPSYYVMQHIDGTPLDVYFSTTRDKTKQLYFANKIIDIFMQLKHHHIRHRDVKADNFFVVGENIFLLDLDNMKKLSRIKYFLTNAWDKDKKRFLRNWQDQPEIQQLFAKLFAQKEKTCQKTK